MQINNSPKSNQRNNVSTPPTNAKNRSNSNSSPSKRKVKAIIKNSKTEFPQALSVIIIMIKCLVILLLMFILFALSLQFFLIIYARVIILLSIITSSSLWFVLNVLAKYQIISTKFKNNVVVDLLSQINKTIKQYCNKHRFLNYMNRIIKGTILVALIISFIPFMSTQATKATNEFWGFFEQIINDISSDNTGTENNTFDETNDTFSDSTESPDPNYPPEMTFIINENAYSNTISSKLYKESYLYLSTNPLQYLNSIFKSKQPNYVREEYYYAQTAEDNFAKAVTKGEHQKAVSGQDNIWYNSLPNEDELRLVIEQQETVAKDYPSFHIFNRLSNNYQKLAKEYHNQSANKHTIKYLYLMSINYDVRCIEYATNEYERNVSIDRIIERYRDILLCCDYNATEKAHLNSLINSLCEAV